MNSNLFKGNRVYLRVLFQSVLCIGLFIVVYASIFGNTIRGNADAQRSASSTKTAIVMTAGALLGPFPTATVPTATASDIPTITSTIPTTTPTATRTLTPTVTLTPSPISRTREAESIDPEVPTAAPNSVSDPPTSAPIDPPTDEPPPATEPPATDPPIELPPIELPPVVRTILP